MFTDWEVEYHTAIGNGTQEEWINSKMQLGFRKEYICSRIELMASPIKEKEQTQLVEPEEEEEEEIDGEIIVLGRSDGGSHFKWYGDTVNPMKIKDKEIILPSIEEYMENLDILVRDIHINEGEYKRKTDRLQKIWRIENDEESEEEDDSEEEENELEVESMVMNGINVLLNMENGYVYRDSAHPEEVEIDTEEDFIGIATRLTRDTWSIFNSRGSGRAPDLITYN
tara:strand:+ start:1264 stop:1941 length:678 start_codon:yes stop_codon:yes gene_type:complete